MIKVHEKLAWFHHESMYTANIELRIKNEDWLSNWELTNNNKGLWLSFAWQSPWSTQEYVIELPHNWVAERIVSARHSRTVGKYIFRLALRRKELWQ